MICFFTTIFILIAIPWQSVLASDEILQLPFDSPTPLETIAERISLRNDVYDSGSLTGPLKDFTWKNRLHMRDTSLGASIIDVPNFEMGMQGGFRESRMEDNDTEISSPGTGENSLEVGFFTQGRYQEYLMGTRVSKDITNGHQGLLGEFMAGYEKRLSEKLDLSLGVGTTWADDQYMSNIYGINAAQSVTTGLPSFTPGGSFKNASLTLTACYQLNQNWSIGAQVGYMRLLGQAAKSPTNQDSEVEDLVTGFHFQYKLPNLSNKKFRNLLQPACSSS